MVKLGWDWTVSAIHRFRAKRNLSLFTFQRTVEGGFMMKRFVNFLFPLLAICLLLAPAWASAPGNWASEGSTVIKRTGDGSGLLPIEALKDQVVLARGGGGGGNGGGPGGGSGDCDGNGSADGSGPGNGNGHGPGPNATVGHQNQHQHQHQDQSQSEQQQHQYQHRHQYNQGQTP